MEKFFNPATGKKEMVSDSEEEFWANQGEALNVESGRYETASETIDRHVVKSTAPKPKREKVFDADAGVWVYADEAYRRADEKRRAMENRGDFSYRK